MASSVVDLTPSSKDTHQGVPELVDASMPSPRQEHGFDVEDAVDAAIGSMQIEGYCMAISPAMRADLVRELSEGIANGTVDRGIAEARALVEQQRAGKPPIE